MVIRIFDNAYLTAHILMTLGRSGHATLFYEEGGDGGDGGDKGGPFGQG